MGKKRIIAETGAGQHGVAVATVAARFGLPCVVYMGATDIERQRPNVFRMKLLGAEVRPVTSGSGTLKDAMNDALRDWVANVHDTFYIIGTVAGPHPYPAMVRDFQSVIGRETREQMLEREGRLPDTLVACIGGGSNAMGLFHPFLDDPSIAIYGVEAGGYGLDVVNGHAASMTGGKPGVLHGNRTYLLQDSDGQILEGHSISAGLDYPGVGPEHSWLKDSGRVNYVAVTDKEALDAFQLCTRLEGIIPALEPSHALAYVKKLAPKLPKRQSLGHEYVRPRRQGHFRRRRSSAPGDVRWRRVSTKGSRELEAAEARRARRLHYCRRPRLRHLAQAPTGPAASRRRHHRARHALLRPHGRRARDPGLLHSGAARRARPWSRRSPWLSPLRENDKTTPIVLMGYYNPIYIYGVDRFLKDAVAAGVDGLIVVDMPPEEDAELRPPANEAGLNFIRLATPTTDAKRLPAVLANTSGFVYYVSIAGITGTAAPDLVDVGAHVGRIKAATEIPIAVGFGVKTKEQVSAIAKLAEGVVVGSALVTAIAQSLDAESQCDDGNGPQGAGSGRAVGFRAPEARGRHRALGTISSLGRVLHLSFG